MTFRSRKLLNLAHDMPCMARFEHDCCDHLGSVPAHSNWQLWGRGFGHKAPDWAWAAMCHNAHQLIDMNATMSREQRETEWTRAYVATQEWLWENNKVRVA